MAERGHSLLSLKELDEAFSGLHVKLHDGLECIHSSRQGALIILFGVGHGTGGLFTPPAQWNEVVVNIPSG